MTFNPFRHPSLPAANLSEVGNASLNVRTAGKNQFLVYTLNRDIAYFIVQNAFIRMFRSQQSKIKQGRGPSVAEVNRRQRNKQMALADAYGEQLSNLWAMVLEVTALFLVVGNCSPLSCPSFCLPFLQNFDEQNESLFRPKKTSSFKPPRQQDEFTDEGQQKKKKKGKDQRPQRQPRTPRLVDVSRLEMQKHIAMGEEVKSFSHKNSERVYLGIIVGNLNAYLFCSWWGKRLGNGLILHGRTAGSQIHQHCFCVRM